MTTAVSTGYLTPGAQIQQFCNSITSLFSSLTESTDSAFKRVHLTKYDANGNIRFYDKKERVIDPVTGESSVVTKQISDLTYIEDQITGELYLDEPQHSVAFKSFLVALATPLYTIAKMSWHTFKTPLEMSGIALHSIAPIGQLFYSGNFCEAAKDTQRAFVQIFEVFGTGLFEIVKAPLFALGCELAALYGIFKPYHGRKYEALIENAWQQGSSHKLDFRNINAREGESCLKAFFKDIQESRPFYLAHCFQVRGNIQDPLMRVTARDPLL